MFLDLCKVLLIVQNLMNCKFNQYKSTLRIKQIKKEKATSRYEVQKIPSGNVILKLFGVNFFTASRQAILQSEHLQIAYAELCFLYSIFPGPYIESYLAWFYFLIKCVLVPESKSNEKLTIEVAKNILLNCKSIFLSDLYGFHLLSPMFIGLILSVLKLHLHNEEHLLKASLIILSQIICISSNFISIEKEEESKKEEKYSSALAIMHKYKEIHKLISPFNELVLKQNSFSGTLLNMSLWITGLDILQNVKIPGQIAFLKNLIALVLSTKLESDLFDQKKVGGLLVVIDLIEVFIWHLISVTDSMVNKAFKEISSTLILLAEQITTQENTSIAKKLFMIKNYGYEKVVCAIIQLCLIISNAIPDQYNVSIIC